MTEKFDPKKILDDMGDDPDPKELAKKLLGAWARSRTKEDKKRMVKEMAEGAGKIVQFAKDVKTGVPLSEALRKAGIDPYDFRRRFDERRRAKRRRDADTQGEGD